MTFNQRAYDQRIRELGGMTKRALARHYISVTGWIGGMHHPRKYTTDELVYGILDREFPDSPRAIAIREAANLPEE